MAKEAFNEIQILQSCAAGDAAAFESIVREYQSLVCAITFSAVGQVEKSEELAQQAFINAWKNLNQLNDLNNFKAWLIGITRNVIRTFFRTQKRDIVNNAAGIDGIDDVADESSEPLEAIITKEQQMMVEQSLQQIPEMYREPMVLFYRQQQSTREVAEALDLTEDTVRTRLMRGRKMLKEQVAAMVESTLSNTSPGKAFTTMVVASVAGLALTSATASAATAATSAGTTATSAASSGLASLTTGITAKIITAAAAVAIGVGGVMAYKSMKEPSTPTLIPQTPIALQQGAVSDEIMPAASTGSGEDTLTANQQLSNEDEQSNIIEQQNQKKKNIQPALISKSAESDTLIDRDNQDENILSLKVVSQETGRPVTGAHVKTSFYGDKQIKTEAETNQFGRYDFRHDQAKFRSLTITVAYEGCVPTKINFRDETESMKLPLNYSLVLEKGASIGGIIINEQDKPVEGVSVRLLVPSDESPVQPSIRADIWDYEVKTDAEGKWRCDIMPSKLDDVWIRLAHSDYIDDHSYGATPKPPMDKLREMTGIMMMKKGIEVFGVVKDTEGNPIADAFVAQGSDRWGTHYPDTRTNEQGQFRFTNAEPGEMILTVSAKGMAPDLKRIEVRPKLEEIKFNLERGNTIRGRVIDSGGNPISGAFVAADTWRGHRSIHWRVNTDNDGYFQWNEAPKDEVLFDLGKQKYMSIRNEALSPLPDDEEWELILYRPLEVSGTVVDAETGEDIQSFKLVAGIKSSQKGELWWSPSDTKVFTNGRYKKIYSEPRYGYALKVEADGYLPSVSRVFSAEEEMVVLDFALEKGDGVSGFVYLADGSPAKDTEVALSTRGISIQEGEIVQKKEKPFCVTDSNGKFSFGPQTQDFVIVALHKQGWGKIYRDELDNDNKIILEPWAHIKGTVYVGSKLGAREKVSLYYDYNPKRPSVHVSDSCIADKQGHFELNKVIAGKIQIGREIRLGSNRSSTTDRERVEVAPGQTLEVIIGGKGRPVAGRFVLPAGSKKKVDWKVGWISISTKLDITAPKPIYPQGFAAMSKEEQNEWMQQWRQSDELTEYRQEVEAAKENGRTYPVIVNEDGTFNCDSVQSGHYQISGHFTEPSNADMFRGKMIGSIQAEFDVPEMQDGVSDEVLNIGNCEVEVINDIEIGQKVSNIEFEDINGKIKKFSDYNGKFVLLDVWSRQGKGDAKAGLEEMAHLYERFGHNPKLVMLSLTNGGSTPSSLMEQYIELYGMNWNIGLYQDYKILRGYGIKDYPCRFLIGPDGKLLGRDLIDEELIDAVEKILTDEK